MLDRHCPFLNREDPRCAAHLQVNHLEHAFEHCAGEYAACPSYRDLLAERIMRRAAESRGVASDARASLSIGGQPYAEPRHPSRPAPPVTLTVAAGARRWSVTDRGLVDAGSRAPAR